MKEDNNFELRKENFMLKQKNQQLKAQIEKMKCCENCKHNYNTLDDNTYCHKCNTDEVSLWELKE